MHGANAWQKAAVDTKYTESRRSRVKSQADRNSGHGSAQSKICDHKCWKAKIRAELVQFTCTPYSHSGHWPYVTLSDWVGKYMRCEAAPLVSNQKWIKIYQHIRKYQKKSQTVIYANRVTQEWCCTSRSRQERPVVERGSMQDFVVAGTNSSCLGSMRSMSSGSKPRHVARSSESFAPGWCCQREGTPLQFVAAFRRAALTQPQTNPCRESNSGWLILGVYNGLQWLKKWFP